MTAETKITFLGCGTSTGVPLISCECEVCRSSNPKNNRTRSSLFLQSESTSLLIDTGPDLRQQLLREGVITADALLFTHGHADHTAGFDETRAFCWRRDSRLPVYGSADTLKILGQMFPWAFDENYEGRGYVRANGIEFSGAFSIGDFRITPFPVIHASIATHGFRIDLPSGKSMIYASDMKSLLDESRSIAQNCDLHILDGLRMVEHPSHMTLAEACELADELDSPCAYMTHMSHEIEYERESLNLPQNRYLAYDGLNFFL